MTVDAAKETIAKMRKIEPDAENENTTGPWIFYWPRGDKSTHYIGPDGWTYTVVPEGSEFYSNCLKNKGIWPLTSSAPTIKDGRRAIIALHDESMSYIGTL
jgi:hypothetical protein